MAKIQILNGKIYQTSCNKERVNVFEIVEKIPRNFFTWNIGENMGTHEYIPICEKLHPENSKSYGINILTLKAIKVAPTEWKKIMSAAEYGVGNLAQAEKAIKSKRHGYFSEKKRAVAANTIEIFKKICE